MNVTGIRADFPFLMREEGERFIYFDNAATAQKPRQVIDTIADTYAYHTANVFRGAHSHAEEVTDMYERARHTIARFIGAEIHEIVMTPGATQGINCVAYTWGEMFIQAGDEIVVSQMEHHSNFLPWQQLALRKGAILRVVPVTHEGFFDMDAYLRVLSHRTKLVAITHTSNVLGVTNDVTQICTHAHAVGARVLVDAAQSIAHRCISVRDIGADFLVYSGHKIFGPTGIGVLYIKKEVAEEMPPYQFGGGMVSHVGQQYSSWLPVPHKFEAGTPPITQAIGLARALEYMVEKINFDDLSDYEAQLCSRAMTGLMALKGVHVIGPVEYLAQHGHLFSFFVDRMHAHDVAAFLDGGARPIAVRAGHHCAQPLHDALRVAATVRASFCVYNTIEEVDQFVERMARLLGE
jgi:cysteine desulfurase / selenocysteine lyase